MAKHPAAMDHEKIFGGQGKKSGCWIYRDGKLVEVKPFRKSEHEVDSLSTLMSQPEYKGYKYIRSEKGQKIQVGYPGSGRRSLV